MSRKGSHKIRDMVREGYGAVAERRDSCCAPRQSCCGPSPPADFAKSIGYSDAELARLPEGANMALSCGNPTALATLKPGETVLDLGCGGGFDVFIAAGKVGPGGRVIGVDMTARMIGKARANASAFLQSTGLDNVEFRLGEIEHLPVADSSVDVVISNCVINLSPDKQQVWNEVARVLRPGGRVAASDTALLKPLPDAVRSSAAALVGCVAGAVPVEETAEMMRAAGLESVGVTTKPEYLHSMKHSAESLGGDLTRGLPSDSSLSEYITSANFTAKKE